MRVAKVFLLGALVLVSAPAMADDEHAFRYYLIKHATEGVTILTGDSSLNGKVAEIGADYICIKQAGENGAEPTQCVPFSAIKYTAQGNKPGITINLKR